METVTVSQASVVSEAPAAVVPPTGGTTMAALPSAVQDLTRFFLNLAGSSSLGAVGGVAGVAASASGVGVQLCPSAPGGDAVTSCAATAVPAGVSGPPPASTAVPGSSGRQRRQETSCPSRRRRHSSSDGTGRASKKRPRSRSPSPDLLLVTGRGPIGHPLSLLRLLELRLLLPELDVRLEVLLAIFALLRRVTARLVLDLRVGRRGRPRERSVIAQVVGVDPPRLRVWRMTTVLVLLIRWTLTGMILSGLSWASSGASTTWKSLHVSHQLDARLLLHRSMG